VTGAGDAVVEARGLVKVYAAEGVPVRAVDGIDLTVEAGAAVSVMGPSGCGKSTLLHLLGGLERQDAGQIVLDGRRVDGLSETAWAVLRRRTIGFVFQSFNLVDELTAVENVELPALLVGAPGRRARRRALELLERMGVAERADHLPDRLSGGERQRVAMARALVNDPLLILADEPTGNLDSRSTGDLLRLFADLRRAGQSLLVVTHDARVASTADHLLTMRDGAIVGHTRLDPALRPGGAPRAGRAGRPGRPRRARRGALSRCCARCASRAGWPGATCAATRARPRCCSR
jgi:putative ABC transport system ATP-binding protein